MKLSFLRTGGLCIRPACGGSVASASAPRVSIIRFTHSSCTAVRGADPDGTTKEKQCCVSVSWKANARIEMWMQNEKCYLMHKQI